MARPDAVRLKVLLVDDQLSHRAALSAELQAMGHDVVEAGNAEDAVALFTSLRPDAVLLDVAMPGHNGHWAAQQIRQAEPEGWTPILFLSGCVSDVDLAAGIEAGGDDYLFKPVSPVVLQAKLRAMQRLWSLHHQLQILTDQLRASNADLQVQSLHDPLTGLANRRGLDIRLDEALRTARREHQPLTLILCDVDNFKAYNDTAGHLQGDQCLIRIAQVLGETSRRPRDLAGRFGGEEFVILLPGTSHSGAMYFAKGLQRLIHQLALPHPATDGRTCVTLSGGITTVVPDGNTTIESLLSRADAALYTAKSLGRDRFFCFETQTDTRTGLAEVPDYDREQGSTATLF
ncbi:diguanylate cyclase [Ideonella sp. B7]|uniref:GGDEF domain-containing response regulator n=1 Tax=Ideonella benzenivorans TaxID=2831643 RepID=UPI001CED0244|nr:diguanylate cyclase [Ideonella benzenivorans]MCA6215477.1 diguanylate cyclase [Ideonella benzenivorans]